MAGYDWTRGKSNNAVQAEQEGLITITMINRWMLDSEGIKLPVNQVKEIVRRCVPWREWHHTSGYFNRTYYYAVEDIVAEIKYLEEHGLLDEYRPAKKQNNVKQFTRMKAYWGYWEGSRNHPRYRETGVIQGVSDGTYFYYVEDSDVKVNLKTIGKLLREKRVSKKKIKGNLFKVVA